MLDKDNVKENELSEDIIVVDIKSANFNFVIVDNPGFVH